MKLVDPTTAQMTQRNARAPRLASIDGLTIGLLCNGKINADALLRETAALFESEHRCRLLEMAFKRNASAPAPRNLIEKLMVECDLLLTATGD